MLLPLSLFSECRHQMISCSFQKLSNSVHNSIMSSLQLGSTPIRLSENVKNKKEETRPHFYLPLASISSMSINQASTSKFEKEPKEDANNRSNRLKKKNINTDQLVPYSSTFNCLTFFCISFGNRGKWSANRGAFDVTVSQPHHCSC